MATSGETHHVVMSKEDGSGELGLMLSPDNNGMLYRAKRIPELPSGEMKIVQKSWHKGFGDYRWDPNEPYRYAFSDGVDLRHANGAQLAPKLESLVVQEGSNVIPNSDFEGTFGWSNASETSPKASATTDEAQAGSYSMKLTGSGAGSLYPFAGYHLNHRVAYLLVSSAASGLGVVEGTILTLNLHSKGTFFRDGSFFSTTAALYIGAVLNSTASLSFPAAISGTNGSQPSATSFPPFQNSTEWENYNLGLPVRVEDGADESSLDYLFLEIRTVRTSKGTTLTSYDSRTGVPVGYLDGLELYVAPSTEAGRLAQFKGAVYLASGQAVYKRNVETGFFALANNFQENVTDITVHGDYLVVGLANNKYAYWDGSGSWTEQTLSYKPDLVDSAIDEQGRSVMYFTNLPNTIYYNDSDDITDTPTDSVTVGNSADNVTAIHRAFDSVMVGKEDGLYYANVYRGTNWAPEDIFSPAILASVKDDINFKAGQEFIDGWFYFGTNLGLERLQFGAGGQVILDNVNPALSAPAYKDYGGPIEGLISDGLHLYAIQCFERADGTSVMNILSGSHEVAPDRKNLVWHTLHQAAFSPPIRDVFINKDQGMLVLFGDTLNINVLAVSQLHQNPLRGPSPLLETSGSLVTSIMDFSEYGFGDDPKGFIKVCVTAEGLSSTKTITVEAQIDDAIDDDGTWTAVGAAITSGPRATVSFPAGSAGRRVRLRFTLASDVSTASPVLREFCIYAVPKPVRYREWEMMAKVDSNQMLLNGASDDRTSAKILAGLNALEAETYPIKIFTPDKPADGYTADIVEMEELLRAAAPLPDGRLESTHLEKLVRLKVREVLTS